MNQISDARYKRIMVSKLAIHDISIFHNAVTTSLVHDTFWFRVSFQKSHSRKGNIFFQNFRLVYRTYVIVISGFRNSEKEPFSKRTIMRSATISDLSSRKPQFRKFLREHENWIQKYFNFKSGGVPVGYFVKSTLWVVNFRKIVNKKNWEEHFFERKLSPMTFYTFY